MNSKKIITTATLALAALFPSSVFAASPRDLRELIGAVLDLINLTIPVIFGFAVLVFLYGILMYIFAHDIKKIGEARNYIIFGIIGLAVMLSVWGLARFVKNSFFENAPDALQGDLYSGGSFAPGQDQILNPNPIDNA